MTWNQVCIYAVVAVVTALSIGFIGFSICVGISFIKRTKIETIFIGLYDLLDNKTEEIVKIIEAIKK